MRGVSRAFPRRYRGFSFGESMPAATAPITGDTGRIKLDDSSLVQFNKWSFSAKAETKSTRAYDNLAGWEESTEATLKMWDGSFSGQFVQSQFDTLLAKLGTKVAGEFVTQSTGAGAGEFGYGGDIILSDVSIEHQVGEIVTAAVTFKGTGPVAPLA